MAKPARIKRLTRPRILAQNAKAWTRELLIAYQQTGKMPDKLVKRYAHQEVKDRLTEMYGGKQHPNGEWAGGLCCYCEGTADSQSYLNIEHYRPKKGGYPYLCFAWRNLHYCCERCNKNKGSRFDKNCRPVIPTADDPLDHYRFEDTLLDGITPRGKWTESNCELNRGGLVNDRGRWLAVVQSSFDMLAKDIDKVEAKPGRPTAESIAPVNRYFKEMRNLMENNSVYSTMMRYHFEEKLNQLEQRWRQVLNR